MVGLIMKTWLQSAANVAKTLLACGLVGGIYGGSVGSGTLSIYWWIAAVGNQLGKPPEIPDLLIVSLVGFAYGLPGGTALGIIGGIIGGAGGWLLGGIVGGAAYGIAHGLFFIYRGVRQEDVLLPLVILPVLGLVLGVAIGKSNSTLPLCNWAGRITRACALNRWPGYLRALSGFALPLTAYMGLLLYVTWPTFWENKRQISRVGLVATWQGSYRLVMSRRYAEYGGRRSTCQSNLKQIGLGMMQYMQDYDDHMPIVAVTAPDPYGWADAIQPYVKSTQILQCPTEFVIGSNDPRKTGYTDYWYNTNLSGLSIAKVTNPAMTLMLGDGNDGTDATNARYTLRSLPPTWLNGTTMPPYRHFGFANYTFVDGHVKSLMPGVPTTAPSAPATFSWK
jgi:prepilin-type processing-associated H-X9-DG protein